MPFLLHVKNDVGFYVYVTPNASHNRIIGFAAYHGCIALKMSVSAPPVDHKANHAVVCFLAEYFNQSKTTFTVIKGHTARLKLVACAIGQETLTQMFKEKGWIIPAA